MAALGGWRLLNWACLFGLGGGGRERGHKGPQVQHAVPQALPMAAESAHSRRAPGWPDVLQATLRRRPGCAAAGAVAGQPGAAGRARAMLHGALPARHRCGMRRRPSGPRAWRG